MTMRQVVGLLRVIGRTELVEFYNQILSYRAANQKELPSLEEFLDLASNKEPTKAQGFDEKADKFLEAEALKRLEERKRRHGG